MAKMLSNNEIKKFIRAVRSMRSDDITTTELDYEEVRQALIQSPELLELLDMSMEDTSLKLDGHKQYYLEDDLGRVYIDDKNAPLMLIALSAGHYEPQSFKKKMRSLFKQLNAWIKNQTHKKRIKRLTIGSIKHTVKNIDQVYLNMRSDILKLGEHYSPKLIELLLLLPDLLVYLIKFVASEQVSIKTKTKLLAAIMYIVVPFDVLPEGLMGPLGYVDDVYLALHICISVLFDSEISKEMLRNHWPGDVQQITKLHGYYHDLSLILGKDIKGIIKRFIKRGHK